MKSEPCSSVWHQLESLDVLPADTRIKIILTAQAGDKMIRNLLWRHQTPAALINQSKVDGENFKCLSFSLCPSISVFKNSLFWPSSHPVKDSSHFVWWRDGAVGGMLGVFDQTGSALVRKVGGLVSGWPLCVHVSSTWFFCFEKKKRNCGVQQLSLPNTSFLPAPAEFPKVVVLVVFMVWFW